jgi:hypothetical protein
MATSATRLEAMHYHPYLILEPFEERIVREWFSGQAALQRLDAAPMAELDSHSAVRIYDLHPEISAPPVTRRIPHSFRGVCLEPE